jgi:hypothetical protein
VRVEEELKQKRTDLLGEVEQLALRIETIKKQDWLRLLGLSTPVPFEATDCRYGLYPSNGLARRRKVRFRKKVVSPKGVGTSSNPKSGGRTSKAASRSTAK